MFTLGQSTEEVSGVCVCVVLLRKPFLAGS